MNTLSPHSTFSSFLQDSKHFWHSSIKCCFWRIASFKSAIFCSCSSSVISSPGVCANIFWASSIFSLNWLAMWEMSFSVASDLTRRLRHSLTIGMNSNGFDVFDFLVDIFLQKKIKKSGYGQFLVNSKMNEYFFSIN